MKRPLPWRTIITNRETGRFTPEQLEQAVRSVMQRTEGARGGSTLAVREERLPFGSPHPAEPATPDANPASSGSAGEVRPSAQRRRTRRKGAAGED